MLEEFNRLIYELKGVSFRSNQPRSINKTKRNNSIDLWDDAVSLGIKVLCARWSLTIFLWMISYLLVMLQIISNGSFIPFTILVFIPMWIGSILAIASVILQLNSICSETHLVSPEHRLFLRLYEDLKNQSI